jgi:peroxiredoxin
MRHTLKLLLISLCFLHGEICFTQNATNIVRDALIFAQKQEFGVVRAHHKVLVEPEDFHDDRKVDYLFYKNNSSKIYPYNFTIKFSDSIEWMKLIFKEDVHYYLKSASDTMSVRKYENIGDEFKSYIRNMLMPLPYGQTKNEPFPSREELDSNFVTCELLRSERIADKNCYVIRIKYKNNESNFYNYIANNKTVWIEKKSNLLWRFESDLHYVLEGDTIRYFNHIDFERIKLGKLSEEFITNEFNIPNTYIEKIIYPKLKPSLIKSGEIAPEWIGKTIDGTEIKLSDFKDKIILLDFFFRGCTGCMQVMPDIIAISNKFKEDEIVVISIDPVDQVKNFKDMKAWLEKKEMTQHVVFTDSQVAKQYGVPAYPSYVLIDREGKIAWSFSGFEKNANMQDVFEREILKVQKQE